MMTISKSMLVFLISIFIFLSIVQAKVTNTNIGTQQYSLADDEPNDIDCGKECVRRCALSSRPNLCHRACGSCCADCGCVPPGTSGNYELCQCYANETTHGGRKKCP